MKSSMLKFISCSGVGSLDLDRRPWLDRPWSDELHDERLGPHPCSSPLTDREWAVLLSLFAVRGRLRKSRTALLVSRGLLRGLTLGGGGRCGGVLPATPPWSVPGAAGPGLLRLVPTIRRRQLHPRPLRNASSSVRPAFTPTPGAGCAEHHCLPIPGTPPRVSSRGSVVGTRV